MSEDKFNSYTYGEGKTGIGQLVGFSCRSGETDKVKEFLEENIRAVEIPITKEINVEHGGFGRYTRFDVEQHRYAGGMFGYIEALEIKNPPDGRCGYVIHEYGSGNGSEFYEFSTLENAVSAWEKNWSIGYEKPKRLAEEEGFIRRVVCYGLSPWFYAFGRQLLIGDFVFSEYMEEDPIFRFNRKFVVRDYDGLPTIKTCIGMLLNGEEKKHRTVFWDDGTVWDELKSYFGEMPRPLNEEELWIQHAMDKFRMLLAGGTSEFTVDFIDGSKFIGRFKPKNKKSHSAEGVYKTRFTLESGKKICRKGNFKPTPEVPTIEDAINRVAERKGDKVASIESVIKISKTRKGNKKWSGVYTAPERE